MSWIKPKKDQMPESCTDVLITDDEGLQIIAWYIAADNMWYSENHSWFTHEIRYWMPIPKIV